MTEKLWAIQAVGPDDYHAMPSEAVARAVAEKHNQCVEKNKRKLAELMIHTACFAVKVVEWPFGSQDHAEEIKNFDYAEWGLERD